MSLKPIDYYNMDKWDIKDERPILQRERKSISLIKKYATGKKMLDVGCGDGQFLEEAARHLGRNWKYFGVDYSKFRLKQAAQRTKFDYAWCNLEKGIPHTDKSFDVVYSGEVIEHIYNPDLMLEECNRVLKKGGILVLSTPNLHVWYNRLLFTFGVQPIFYETSTKSAHIGSGPIKRIKKQTVPVGHIRLFNRRSLTDLLEAEGFKVIEFRGAIFQSLPRAFQTIDNVFNTRPSLASNLVVVARKVR